MAYGSDYRQRQVASVGDLWQETAQEKGYYNYEYNNKYYNTLATVEQGKLARFIYKQTIIYGKINGIINKINDPNIISCIITQCRGPGFLLSSAF